LYGIVDCGIHTAYGILFSVRGCWYVISTWCGRIYCSNGNCMCNNF